MAELTKVQWCHHTFNPWSGCAKVSPGCAHCYAEKLSHVNPGVLGVWGEHGEREVTGEANWAKPLAWNRKAKEANERRRVFCASMGDWLEDRPELDAPRSRLLETIEATPWLDWLLLTKRPENWRPLMDRIKRASQNAASWKTWGEPLFDSIWVGASVEDQACAESRIPKLLEIPAKIHFLSVEPLLGPVDLTPWLDSYWVGDADPDGPGYVHPGIDWVIVGGESGPGARPCNLAWIRSVRDQCQEANVSVFVKQLGARPCIFPSHPGIPGTALCLKNKKGGDPSEWPADLRIREFPR